MEQNQQLQNVQGNPENKLPENLRTRLSSTQQQIFLAYQKHERMKVESLDSLSSRIKAMLVPMTVILAIPTQPNDIEISILAHYLKENHPLLTLEEVVIALKMNSSNQFPKKIEHYGQFSGSYISDVIYQYQDHAKLQTVLKVKEIMDNQESEKPKEVATPEQCYNFIKKYKQEFGSVPKFADWHKAFDWMWQNGLTKPKDELIEWMNFEKSVLIAKITGLIKTASDLSEKRELEAQIEEDAIKLELRKM